MPSQIPSLRQAWTAARALLIFTLVLGVGYPALVTVIGHVGFTHKAEGSPVFYDGVEVGSSLIGQSFTDASGHALPEWFQSRPSAAGEGYDGAASSGSNLGPNNPHLVTLIGARQAAISTLDGLAAADIPADAVTASGSGLDPDISPEYALLQVPRVAAARGLNEQEVRDLVESTIQGRDLGVVGAPRVNVVKLNIALAELDSRG